MADLTESDTAVDDSSVEPGVWRYARAERAAFIIDAEDYFRHMQQAMLRAQKRILLIGWDFDTRIHLETGRRWWQKGKIRKHPRRLGGFVPWLTREERGLEVYILRWGIGFFSMFLRGAMTLDLMRWMPKKRITFKADTAHPLGGSHHQKIVIIDDKLAVCGGIDMTSGRWDTRDHNERERRRRLPGGKTYAPWHDATMMVEGEIATVLGDLGRDRWRRAGGDVLPPVEGATGDRWPEHLTPHFTNVEIGIARTRAKYDGKGGESPQVQEIAELFERHIRSARKFIYAESQYFASRRVAEALCKRLMEPDPPEVLIVHPANADGWLEQQAMDHACAQLVATLGEADPQNRFNLYVPYTGETPIYVHAKIMIVDDRILRVGSANMNNRSMGLDSECDLFIDSDRPGNGHVTEEIARLRHDLLAEHCGLALDEVAQLIEQHGSMHAMIQALGTSRTRTLRRFELPELTAVQAKLAESTLLDPEKTDELLEPFAKGGLFRKSMRLSRIRDRLKRKKA